MPIDLKRFFRLAHHLLNDRSQLFWKFAVKKLFSLLAVAGAALVAQSAQAAVITTLFNTGVNAAGAVVANATAGDLHYSLVSPGQTPAIQAVTSAFGYPLNSAWVGDNITSRWIGPQAAELRGVDGGTYIYQTTFDLTGFDFMTAAIQGQLAADDKTSISLNGQEVFALGGTYGSWKTFSITTDDFIAGVNTLQFAVINSGNGPTGLRVEMTGSADVPEPASLALVALGLIGAGLAGRRRQA